MFVVRVWGGQYREELILNVIVFVVRVWGEQYREELIQNVAVFEDLAEDNLESLLRVAINCARAPAA